MEDIKDIAEEKETPVPALATPVADEETKEVDEESDKKAEQLANLNRAIREANEELKQIRLAKKATKDTPPKEDELPTIDFNDPSAKAWDNRIRESVSPVKAEMDEAKQEVRTFALQEFLKDKPALAKSPEKVKELMGLYDRIKVATERTVPGVLLDLNKAYAALHADTLIAAARGERLEKAEADSIFSDIAVSRGASSYQQSKRSPATKGLTKDDEKFILRNLGYDSIEAWAADKEKYGA